MLWIYHSSKNNICDKLSLLFSSQQEKKKAYNKKKKKEKKKGVGF